MNILANAPPQFCHKVFKTGSGAYGVLFDQLLHVMTRPWVSYIGFALPQTLNCMQHAKVHMLVVAIVVVVKQHNDWSDVNTLIDFESQLTGITCLYG